MIAQALFWSFFIIFSLLALLGILDLSGIRRIPDAASRKWLLGTFLVQVAGGIIALFMRIFIQQEFEVWTVRGRAVYAEALSPPIQIRAVTPSIVPPNHEINSDGLFTVRLVAKKDKAGSVEYPEIKLDAPGYITANVLLSRDVVGGYSNPLSWRINEAKSEVRIETPVKLFPDLQPFNPQRASSAEPVLLTGTNIPAPPRIGGN